MFVLGQLGTGLTILLGLLVILIMGLVYLVIQLNKRMCRMEKAYRRTFRTGRGQILEEMIQENVQAMEEATRISKEVGEKMERWEAKMARTIQNVGLVRYRAFKNSSADLSFSIAMLDANMDGFVLTNIFGGTNCSVYTKPVENGKSDFILSSEEKQAIEIAMSDKPAKVPPVPKKPTIPSMIAAVVANNILAPKE